MPWGFAAAGAASGLVGVLGSKNGGSTTSQSNSTPWIGQAPHLENIYQNGLGLSQTNTLLGGQSPQTLQAQQMTAQRAMSGSPLNQAAQQQNLATLRGDYTDLSKNPAAQNAMNMARGQINSQFTGDNYGNSAHQEWLGKGLMQAASPFYESERQRQQGATALAPSLANQDYTDLSQLGMVGSQMDQRSQQQQEEPWQRLERYMGLVQGNPGGASTSQQPYFTNPTASAMGGALGGLGLYNQMNQGGLLGGRGYTGENLGGPTSAWGMTGGTF